MTIQAPLILDGLELVIDAEKAARLTPKEQDVLLFRAAGFTEKATAKHLGVSPETIKTHCKNILMKLQAKSTTEAVSLSWSKKFICTKQPTPGSAPASSHAAA